MSDQGEIYETSWILYHILERLIGSREKVAALQTQTVITDHLARSTKSKGCNCEKFTIGSWAEGMRNKWSDVVDLMFIDKNVIVMCPEQSICSQLDRAINKTVLMMREGGCRPGFVKLQVLKLGRTLHSRLFQSIVPAGDVEWLSSEIYRHEIAESVNVDENTDIHGPAVTQKGLKNKPFLDVNKVSSFPCYNWPIEANEWASRPRLNGWPDEALRDQIVQDGCHLVPVGDKTSTDQFLQWGISFSAAERKLIHSFSHVQFLVYGLLKYFRKQISGMLEEKLGEADILSSYVIKTVVFHAVELTAESFWQEQHMFFCFMFCFKILVNWVKAGHCPNYFIKKNNMFLGIVQGQIQEKLLRFLTDLYGINLGCLSVGTFTQPSIGERIRSVRKGACEEYVLPTPSSSERTRDFYVFDRVFYLKLSPSKLPLTLELLLRSMSDTDEFIAYFATVQALSQTGMKTFNEHLHARGNKEKYKSLRKCKNLLKPFAAVTTNPGQLTFHYQTGNYTKALEMCEHMLTPFKTYLDITDCKYKGWYERLYCGHGYSLLQKCQAFVSDIIITEEAPQFCPPQLRPEIRKAKYDGDSIRIPPHPYAAFMSFLCYHELGDTKRRDKSLTDLWRLKSHEDQGCSKNWIVHILLGICYETLGDKRGAIREYTESLTRQGLDVYLNAAKERLERLKNS